MLEQLCELVGKTGELRQEYSRIDFNRIYSDADRATQARHNLQEKMGVLAELQYDLLKMIKEV